MTVTKTIITAFTDDDTRWAAVTSRNPSADTHFVYGVRTTRIYCRPVCKARLARRANVVFFARPAQAQRAGFRACKRCRPETGAAMPEEEADRKVRRMLQQQQLLLQAGSQGSQVVPAGTSGEMARGVGLSKWHFHRTFKKVTGKTPRQYFAEQQAAAAAREQHQASAGGGGEHEAADDGARSVGEAMGITGIDYCFDEMEWRLGTDFWDHMSTDSGSLPSWDEPYRCDLVDPMGLSDQGLPPDTAISPEQLLYSWSSTGQLTPTSDGAAPPAQYGVQGTRDDNAVEYTIRDLSFWGDYS